MSEPEVTPAAQASACPEVLIRAATAALQLPEEQGQLADVVAAFVAPLLPLLRLSLGDLERLHPLEIEALRRAALQTFAPAQPAGAETTEQDWNAQAEQGLVILRELRERDRGA